MRKIISIQPKQETFDTLIIEGVQIRTNEAIVAFQMRYTQSEYTITGIVEITPEEYEQWGTDDNYIYDLVLSKLGLVEA